MQKQELEIDYFLDGQNFEMKFNEFCHQRHKQYIRVEGYSCFVEQNSQPDTIDIFQVNNHTLMKDIKHWWFKKYSNHQIILSQNQQEYFQNKTQYLMTLELKFYLQEQTTISQLKHKIQITHCNYNVKIYIFHQQYSQTITQSAIKYEDYEQRNISQIQTTFKIQNSPHKPVYFSLETPRRIKISQLKHKLIQKLSSQFQTFHLKYDSQSGFRLKIKFDALTQQKINIINEDLSYDKIKIQNGFIDLTFFDTLYLRQICPPGQIIYFEPMKPQSVKFIEKKQFEFDIKILINCVRKIQTNFQKFLIVSDYQTIKNIQVSALLTEFRIYDSMLTAVIIENLIIKPYQKFNILEKIIKTNKKNIYQLNAIPQNLLFYKELLSFDDQKHIMLIEDLKHLHTGSSFQSKNNFQAKFQRRRNELINTEKIFGDLKTIQILLLYTGPFFYNELNKFMRNNSLALIKNNSFDIKNWQYPFCQKMVKSLNKLPNYQGFVYRGSKGHKYNIKQGQVIEWNGFTSTTNNINIAFKFLSPSYVYPYVFEIQTFSGKFIANYSFYKNQSQVLILPYTKFKVIQVSHLCLNKQKQIINFIQLKQLPLPKFIPGKLIIWIDNNFKPNAKSFYKIIKDNNIKDIELIQLDSNQHLEMWLKQFSSFLNQSLIKVAFITNLNRPPFYQNEGINTFKIIKSYSLLSKVVYYIQKINQKIKILQKAGINIDNQKVFIASKHQQLQKIIVNKLWKQQY